MRKGFKTNIVKTAIILCIILLFTTCQTAASSLKEPNVSLYSVALTGINFTGAQMLCKVQVENPNAFEIPLPEVNWELFVNTNSFVSGVVKNSQNVKARDSTFIDIPINLDYLDIFNTFISMKGRSESDYKIALAVKIPVPILGELAWNFEHEGNFPLLQAPRLAAPSMRLDRIDLSSVDFLVSINIENPNPFELPAPKFIYDYLVNRNSFMSSTIESSNPLAASSVTPFVFRLSVNYADLFRNFQSLSSSSGSVTSLLDLSCDFGVPALSEDNFSMQIPGSLPLR
jgi:LEA14-like dessication related protein